MKLHIIVFGYSDLFTVSYLVLGIRTKLSTRFLLQLVVIDSTNAFLNLAVLPSSWKKER